MSEERETEETLRPTSPRVAAEPLTEWGEGELVDTDQDEELKEDLAAAQEAMEEYEATGIEGTISYSQYRSKWLGLES